MPLSGPILGVSVHAVWQPQVRAEAVYLVGDDAGHTNNTGVGRIASRRCEGEGMGPARQVVSVGLRGSCTPFAERQSAEEESPRGLIQPRVEPPDEARTSAPPLWEVAVRRKGMYARKSSPYGAKAWSRGSAICNRFYMKFHEEGQEVDLG